MCLKIITHTMRCDVRPIMQHPLRPNAWIVDPFALPQTPCCKSEKEPTGMLCPTHGCCQLSVRTFPCGCGNSVGYHRYEPSQTPAAFAANDVEIPEAGTWRKLQCLDNVHWEKNHGKRASSEQLDIAQRGEAFFGSFLEPKAKELTAAITTKELKEANLRNGAPFQEQVKEAEATLERVEMETRELRSSYYTWKSMMDRLQKIELKHSTATEMLA
ncbi:hypothetical protein F5Y18DRAFT_434470 [Xylariaceae sp. FL1019]|nr:hypothetical protein F5Y18DRAFT_434470 [Xylariaceae sp. FL1019]